ncbi:hypothetical protein K438DRAFT_1977289 [Mycena galopus ATCC 62051]|nr:hypothetical protein K438DRAFT_1977289 [Mycena galopus ATCC 62051]
MVSMPRQAIYAFRVPCNPGGGDTTAPRIPAAQGHWWTETCDAVVVATGHATEAHVPEIKDGRYNIYPRTHSRSRAVPASPYQSAALQKVWTGAAPLPNAKRMWRDYNSAKYRFGILFEDCTNYSSHGSTASLGAQWPARGASVIRVRLIFPPESVEFTQRSVSISRGIITYYYNAHYKTAIDSKRLRRFSRT